jgi:hypothetical protein
VRFASHSEGNRVKRIVEAKVDNGEKCETLRFGRRNSIINSLEGSQALLAHPIYKSRMIISRSLKQKMKYSHFD